MPISRGDIEGLFDLYRGINPPKSVAEQGKREMLTANDTPSPIDSPQSKPGVACPSCGAHHKPGSPCPNRTKSLPPLFVDGILKAEGGGKKAAWSKQKGSKAGDSFREKLGTGIKGHSGGNPYHDSEGKFTTEENAVSVTKKEGAGAKPTGRGEEDAGQGRGSHHQEQPKEDTEEEGGVHDLFDLGQISGEEQFSGAESPKAKQESSADEEQPTGAESPGAEARRAKQKIDSPIEKPQSDLNKFSDKIYDQAYKQHLDAGLSEEEADQKADYASFDAMMAFHEAQDRGIDPSELNLDQVSELANAQKEKRVKESASKQEKIREKFGDDVPTPEERPAPSEGAQQRFLDFMDQMKPPEQRAGGGADKEDIGFADTMAAPDTATATQGDEAPPTMESEGPPTMADPIDSPTQAEQYPAGALAGTERQASDNLKKLGAERKRQAKEQGKQDKEFGAREQEAQQVLDRTQVDEAPPTQVDQPQQPGEPGPAQPPQQTQPGAEEGQQIPDGTKPPGQEETPPGQEATPEGPQPGSPEESGVGQAPQKPGRAPKKQSLGVPFSQWYGAGASVGSGLSRPGGAFQPTGAFAAQRAHMLLNPDIPTNRGTTMAHPGTSSTTKEYKDIGMGSPGSGGGVQQSAQQSGAQQVQRSLEALFDE